jgi:cysteine desulfuration protein SufE
VSRDCSRCRLTSLDPTIGEAQLQIAQEFSRLDDLQARYEYLVDLGRRHEPLDERFKVDEYAMPGCQSQVWIRPWMQDGRLRFQADSDSLIVKGVLVLLLRMLDNRSPAEIAAARINFLEDVGLATSLSPARANGLAAIIRHMQQCAARLGESSSP